MPDRPRRSGRTRARRRILAPLAGRDRRRRGAATARPAATTARSSSATAGCCWRSSPSWASSSWPSSSCQQRLGQGLRVRSPADARPERPGPDLHAFARPDGIAQPDPLGHPDSVADGHPDRQPDASASPSPSPSPTAVAHRPVRPPRPRPAPRRRPPPTPRSRRCRNRPSWWASRSRTSAGRTSWTPASTCPTRTARPASGHHFNVTNIGPIKRDFYGRGHGAESGRVGA